MPSETAWEPSLTRGGWVDRLNARLGQIRQGRPRAVPLALAAGLLGWLPPALLMVLESGGRWTGPSAMFFVDLTTYARSLAAVPLFIIAEAMVDLYVGDAALRLREVVEPSAGPSFQREMERVERRSTHWAGELLALGLTYLFVALRLTGVVASRAEHWYQLGWGLSPGRLAGWWYELISVPLFLFLALRWAWRYGWWLRFLLRTSRLPMRLLPSHPDRAGGLGFLGYTQGSFASVIGAFSVVIAAGWAENVRAASAPLSAYFFPLVVLVVGVLLLFVGPTVVFLRRLLIARVTGHRPFDALVLRYHQQFEAKWVTDPGAPNPLGNQDIQSLNDLNGAFDTAHRMRVLPLGLETARPILFAALAPMALPIAMTIPLHQLARRLFEHLL